MAETHRGLLRWFASSNPFFSFLKVIPLFIGYGYFLIKGPIPLISALTFFIVGILFWSFFEYAVHRWMYHKKFKNKKVRWLIEAFHLHHHRELRDYAVLNAGLLLIYPTSLLILGIVFILSWNPILTSAFGAGMTLYYVFYEYVHYQIHYKKHEKGYLKFIQNYHLHHHYNHWLCNFGNTTSLWDRLLGTYDPDYKNLILNESQKIDFKSKI